MVLEESSRPFGIVASVSAIVINLVFSIAIIVANVPEVRVS